MTRFIPLGRGDEPQQKRISLHAEASPTSAEITVSFHGQPATETTSLSVPTEHPVEEQS